MANVRAAGKATVARGHSVRHVRMVELSAEDARPLLRVFPEEVPTGVGFMKRAGLVSKADRRNSKHWPAAARSFDWTEFNNLERQSLSR